EPGDLLDRPVVQRRCGAAESAASGGDAGRREGIVLVGEQAADQRQRRRDEVDAGDRRQGTAPEERAQKRAQKRAEEAADAAPDAAEDRPRAAAAEQRLQQPAEVAAPAAQQRAEQRAEQARRLAERAADRQAAGAERLAQGIDQ